MGRVLLPDHAAGGTREAGRRRRPAVGASAAVRFASAAGRRRTARREVEVRDLTGMSGRHRDDQRVQPLPDLRVCTPDTPLHLHGAREARGSGPRACAGTGMPATQGLVQSGGSYTNEFRTLPDPDRAARRSVHVRRHRRLRHRHPPAVDVDQAAARSRARRCSAPSTPSDVRLILTTGDNIYAAQRFLLWTEGFRRRRRRLVLHVLPAVPLHAINRVPVCPSIGNHDTRETEECDDRGQVHGQLLSRDAARQRRGGRAARRSARACSIASGSPRTSSSCASIRPRNISSSAGGCSAYPKHREFVRNCVSGAACRPDRAGASRSPRLPHRRRRLHDEPVGVRLAARHRQRGDRADRDQGAGMPRSSLPTSPPTCRVSPASHRARAEHGNSRPAAGAVARPDRGLKALPVPRLIAIELERNTPPDLDSCARS